ncbi:MAG TPA: site-specific integrase [Anaerolineae bacterium]|nr:site-specific integrase [Anaerolineae bacterium]
MIRYTMSQALLRGADKKKLLVERAKEYARRSRAENTLRAYRAAWTDFAQFCADHDADALPALPETVAAYLTFLAQHQKISTLVSKIAAIRFRHRAKGLPDPTHSEVVELVLDGIKRNHGAPPNAKAPVTRAELQRMVNAFPRNLAGLRNRAMILLGYAADLRRSELVALRVEDVQFLSDRMIVTIRHSKTDQHGAGYAIHIPQMQDEHVCPVRALRAWLRVAAIQSGRLFRGVDRWGHIRDEALTDKVVALVVKKAAERIGLNARDFAGHSLRRGMITQAGQDQAQAYDVRKVSRHKSDAMLNRYMGEEAKAQMRVIRRVLGEVDG